MSPSRIKRAFKNGIDDMVEFEGRKDMELASIMVNDAKLNFNLAISEQHMEVRKQHSCSDFFKKKFVGWCPFKINCKFARKSKSRQGSNIIHWEWQWNMASEQS